MHKYSRSAATVATLLLWLLIEACSGLIYDDTNGCDTDVTLRFAYRYNGSDLLKEKIKTVRLFLFDANGIFFGTRRVTAAEYAANNVPLALPNGKYTIVTLGNLTELSTVYPTDMKEGVTPLSDFYKAHSDVQTGKPVQGNNPIYLSTLEADIPPYPQTETYTAEFDKAHISLNIYVNNNGSPSESGMRLELRNVYPHLTFGGEATGSATTYHPEGVEDGEATSLFSANIFGKEAPYELTVVLKDAQGKVLKEVKLADYLKENNIEWDVAAEKEIDLVIAWYKNAWIGITIERWKEIQITPEY